MGQLKILNIFKSLEEKDIEILISIEKLMSRYLNVKLEDIVKLTGYTYSFIEKKIQNYDKVDLLETKRVKEVTLGVKLNFMSYDALALHELVKKNVLLAVGKSIGVGKESHVFEGMLANNEPCVLKFHKLGKTRFKATKRKRDFLANKKHISRLYESTLNAKREFKALKELAGIIPVPEVYGYNRHVIVMQRINGVELYKVKNLSEDDYNDIYNRLVEYIIIMLNSNFIHADFSIYNILIEDDSGSKKIYIIDLPQFVTFEHPNALEKLLVDIDNIYNYFNKKIKLNTLDVEKYGEKLFYDTRKRLKIRNHK